MVEALVCTQDWLRRATPINIEENTEELAKLEEGSSILPFVSIFNFQQLFNVSFVCCFLFVEIIQELKDKATVDAHAAPSQIQGSKKRWLHPPTSAHSQAKAHSQANA
jgi:hypothetical protein